MLNNLVNIIMHFIYHEISPYISSFFNIDLKDSIILSHLTDSMVMMSHSPSKFIGSQSQNSEETKKETINEAAHDAKCHFLQI
jgi:hypothetical protein